MSYTSQESKLIKLPFSLICKYKLISDSQSQQSDVKQIIYDFQCIFQMNELNDVTTEESFFPLISQVKVKFYFPNEVADASLTSKFTNIDNQQI